MPVIEGIMIERIKQSTIKITTRSVKILIDPFEAPGDPVDLILITHNHYDHCDKECIEKVRKKDTVIIGSETCPREIDGIEIMKPNETREIHGVRIESVHAYNLNKPFHRKGECLGYVINIEGKRVYHAGDTDRIPEMKALGDIDIAMLPVGGKYTMDADEAAAAVNEDIKPKVAIPMHYGDVVGSSADAYRFKDLCETEVVIL